MRLFDLLWGFIARYGDFFWSLAFALLLLVLVLALRGPVLRLLFGFIARLGGLRKGKLLPLLGRAAERPARALVLLAGCICAAALLRFPSEPFRLFWSGMLLRLLRVGVLVCLTWALAAFVTPEAMEVGLLGRSGERLGRTFCIFFSRVLRVIVAAFGIVMALGEFGFDPGGLIAGLGLGGLTLALAAQDWASNLFGGVVILFDRPFAVEDWIQVEGTIEGIVEDVTFRSTRIRTFDNAQVVVPNSALVSKPIINWSRMQKRKIAFDIGLTYDTPPEKLRVCVERLRGMLREDPDICKEPQSVTFDAFADSSLQIRIHCFSALTGFTDYMRVKERLNFKIAEIVAGLGLQFAFPSQTVYFAGEGDGEAPEAGG